MDNSSEKGEGKGYLVVSKLPNRKYGFFRDDQITFLVTHPGDGLTEDQLERFRLRMNPFLENRKLGSIEDRQSMSTTSFPPLTKEEEDQCHAFLERNRGVTFISGFSYITASLAGAPANPIELMEGIKILREDLKEGSKDGEQYVEVDGFRYDLRRGLPIDEMTVEGASLNWLTSLVSQGAGTGGPGGIPTPYYGSRRNAPYTFEVVHKLKGCNIYGDGEGVDIAILDTAPSPHELAAAHKEWHDHPLIKDLLGLDGKLKLYPLSYDETLRLANTSINGSDYKMTDHGLFIAGIIHSIVPKAQIHLIEVLNQYGVGDFSAFTAGLEKARSLERPGRKLLVNCSWMLELPADVHHCHGLKNPNQVLTDPDLEFERQVYLFGMDDQMTLQSMKALFTHFAANDRGAIAAAGNDAYENEEEPDPLLQHVRPMARYPAALSEVSGVGALPATLETFTSGTRRGKYKASPFSNLSDRTANNVEAPKAGIATLGGEAGDGKGILGLYIGEFPDGRLNTSKWAWWAGTSFATPIITGVYASVLSNRNEPVSSTEEAVGKLQVNDIIRGKTDANEEVLATTQC